MEETEADSVWVSGRQKAGQESASGQKVGPAFQARGGVAAGKRRPGSTPGGTAEGVSSCSKPSAHMPSSSRKTERGQGLPFQQLQLFPPEGPCNQGPNLTCSVYVCVWSNIT